MIVAICDGVAICDWKCRTLWRVLRFVTENVAIYDIEICNLMTHIRLISINILFSHHIYSNMRLVYRICPYMVSAALTYSYTSYFGHSNNLVKAQNSKSENDVRSLQHLISLISRAFVNIIRHIPEVHSGTSCLVNYLQYMWQIMRKWVKTQPLRFMSNVNMGTLPSTQNTFSALLHSVCQFTALITNCDKSQIAI